MQLKYKKLRPGAQTPTRATPGSAALDLYALCGPEGITLPPRGRAAVPTGIAIELPGPETVGLLFPRSGLALKSGVGLPNAVGVIDSDYRGEIFVALVNLSETPYTVQSGERIGQLAVVPVLLPTLCETDTLGETARGAGGFGSTGRL